MRLRGGAGAREDVRLWVTCECVSSEQNREESLCSPSAGGEASGRRAASDSEKEK